MGMGEGVEGYEAAVGGKLDAVVVKWGGVVALWLVMVVGGKLGAEVGKWGGVAALWLVMVVEPSDSVALLVVAGVSKDDGAVVVQLLEGVVGGSVVVVVKGSGGNCNSSFG